MKLLIEEIEIGIHNKKQIAISFGDSDSKIEHSIMYMNQIKELAINKLELEKNQIIEAYDDALSSCESLDGLEYYANKFNK